MNNAGYSKWNSVGVMTPDKAVCTSLVADGYGSIPAIADRGWGFPRPLHFVLDCLEEGKNIAYALLTVVPCEIIARRAKGAKSPPASESQGAHALGG